MPSTREASCSLHSKGYARQVEDGVGERRDRRRRGRDLEAAVVGDAPRRPAHRLGHRARVDLAVRRERLRRRRRPHRQVDVGRVGRARPWRRRPGSAPGPPARPSPGSAPPRGRGPAPSPAGRRRPSGSRSSPARPRPRAAARSVWFWTTTGSSNRSPKLRKRGGDGRTMMRQARRHASPRRRRTAASPPRRWP